MGAGEKQMQNVVDRANTRMEQNRLQIAKDLSKARSLGLEFATLLIPVRRTPVRTGVYWLVEVGPGSPFGIPGFPCLDQSSEKLRCLLATFLPSFWLFSSAENPRIPAVPPLRFYIGAFGTRMCTLFGSPSNNPLSCP